MQITITHGTETEGVAVAQELVDLLWDSAESDATIVSAVRDYVLTGLVQARLHKTTSEDIVMAATTVKTWVTLSH